MECNKFVYASGYVTLALYMITDQMDIAVGASLTSKLDIPGLFKVNTKTTTKVSVKNAQTSRYFHRLLCCFAAKFLQGLPPKPTLGWHLI
jgi:hypothetical protein